MVRLRKADHSRKANLSSPSVGVLLFVIASIILISTPVACQARQPWKGLVKIGLVLPFTRYDTHTAYEALMGTRLALREWNGKGGIAGYRLELVALDDENEGTTAMRRANELITDPDVLGVVGHLSSSSALGAAEEYRQSQMPLLTLASASALTARGDKYVLRLGPNDEQVALSILESVSGRAAAGRFAIVKDDVPASAGIAQAIEREVARRGSTVVFHTTLDTSSRSFADSISQIVAQRAEVVFFLGDYRQAAAFYAELRRGPGQVGFLALAANTSDFLKVGGAKLQGAMYLSPWPPADSETEAAKKFSEQYLALAGATPSHYAQITYDATTILLGVAERGSRTKGRPTRDATLRELASIVEFNGVGGSFVFDEKGDLRAVRPVVYEIQSDGSYPGVAIK